MVAKLKGKHVPAPPIEADGLMNWRDIGGVPSRRSPGTVREGLLYRSESLAELPPATLEKLRAREIGIIVDLRSVEEVERYGRFSDSMAEWLHRPLAGPTWLVENATAEGDPMAAMYRSMTTEMAPVILEVIEIVANAGVPVIIHCTSGKDRTGVVAALVQTLLGVEDSTVMAEYLASADNLVGHMHAMEARYPEMAASIPVDLKARVGGVERGWLEAAFEPVTTAGGIDDWLVANGLTTDIIDRLRTRLLG